MDFTIFIELWLWFILSISIFTVFGIKRFIYWRAYFFFSLSLIIVFRIITNFYYKDYGLGALLGALTVLLIGNFCIAYRLNSFKESFVNVILLSLGSFLILCKSYYYIIVIMVFLIISYFFERSISDKSDFFEEKVSITLNVENRDILFVVQKLISSKGIRKSRISLKNEQVFNIIHLDLLLNKSKKEELINGISSLKGIRKVEVKEGVN